MRKTCYYCVLFSSRVTIKIRLVSVFVIFLRRHCSRRARTRHVSRNSTFLSSNYLFDFTVYCFLFDVRGALKCTRWRWRRWRWWWWWWRRWFADPLGNFLELMQLLMGVQYAGLNPASLVKEAAQGHTDTVRRILAQHPTQVRHCWCKCWPVLWWHVYVKCWSINQSVFGLLKTTTSTKAGVDWAAWQPGTCQVGRLVRRPGGPLRQMLEVGQTT